MNKRENWNEHPKSPPQSKKDDLSLPYIDQINDMKSKQKNFTYDPKDHAGLDFHTQFKTPTTFSPRAYFKSVFVSGGDAEKELEDYKKLQLEKFAKKVVVDSLLFKVNTIVKGGRNNDSSAKYKSMLDDTAKKQGLLLSKKQIKVLNNAQIQAQRSLSPVPIGQFSGETYRPNEFEFKSSRSLLPDINRTPINKHDGSHESRNFNRFASVSPFAKRHVNSVNAPISPIKDHEKTGPKWLTKRHMSTIA